MQGPGVAPQSEQSVQINEHIVRANIENLRLEQNLALGIIGGGLGGLVGAIIWAAITYLTEYQIGWMAVGIGFLVGLGVGKLGKGIDKLYGVIGAVIALISVVLGNFLVYIGFLAKYFEIGYFQMLLEFNYAMTLELFIEMFNVIDVLFYVLAVTAGYKYSFRKISQERLLEGAVTTTSREIQEMEQTNVPGNPNAPLA